METKPHSHNSTSPNTSHPPSKTVLSKKSTKIKYFDISNHKEPIPVLLSNKDRTKLFKKLTISQTTLLNVNFHQQLLILTFFHKMITVHVLIHVQQDHVYVYYHILKYMNVIVIVFVLLMDIQIV